MKTFINDQRIIGRWKHIGAIKNNNATIKAKVIDDHRFPFKELYFLPNGEQYWVISWTKGFVRIKDTDHPYEIIDNRMYLEVRDINDEAEFMQVFEQIDHKSYSKQEIRIYDDINVSFELDEQVVGKWQAIDFVSKLEDFTVKKPSYDDLWLKAMTIKNDGTMTIEIANGETAYGLSWTKGKIIDKQDVTASGYEIRNINGTDYLFMEWKSGDYIYGHWQPAYYVFNRGA